MDKKMNKIVNELLADYKDERVINKIEYFEQPDTDVIKDIIKKLIKIIFPGFFSEKKYRVYNINSQLTVLIEDVICNLTKQIVIALKQKEEYKNLEKEELKKEAREKCYTFFSKLIELRAYTETDVQAAYEGDPAAFNKNEIILSYPGLYAITIARLAHILYELEIPIIPRIMTEHAHHYTGIDIHPGATLGKYLFIDHGTGIVIGETTVIGDCVKIYQGVTLGALSTRGGQKLKNKKRHPTIENNVTIYSGASILGGETVIGAYSIIGSNAFITSSLPAWTKVSVKKQDLSIRTKQESGLEEI